MTARLQVTAVALDDPVHRAALRTLLDGYARSTEGGAAALPVEALARLPDVLAASGCYAGWIAWLGNDAIGLVNAFFGVSTFRAAPLLNLHDVFVVAAHRRSGVGRALLAAAESTARARGCCKLTLEVLQGNAAAITAYRRAGFVPYRLDPAIGQAMFLEKTLLDPIDPPENRSA